MYLNVEKTLTVKLCNHSSLEAAFNWFKAEGDDASSCQFTIEPNSGTIQPKSTLECTVKFTCAKLGNIEDLRVPCYIKEMPEPLFLSLKAVVKGVAVSYYYSTKSVKESDIGLKQFDNFQATFIDFGDCKIGEEIERYLYIRNESAIETRLSFSIRTFQAIEANKLNKNNFADPMRMGSKLAQDYRLKNNESGIAFVPEMACLVLAPFDTVCLRLFALVEMWGHYEDVLIVGVDGLWFEHQIPIRAKVVDLPIKLYTGKVTENENEKISMLRFGSQIQGCGAVTRKLKILNSSWLPIEIDWKCYLVEKSDAQLLDLNIIYEDPYELETREQIDSNRTHSVTHRLETTVRVDDNGDDSDVDEQESNFGLGNKLTGDKFKSKASSVATSNDYSDTYIYIERIPFIKLNLTSHYGREVTEENPIFQLNKTKMV